MDFGFLIEVLKESAVLCLVVVGMMLAIEACNISSGGKLFLLLHKSHIGQIVASALLGVIPGCIGGYVAVSFYSKRMFSFGALLSMALATTGDESFVMLASFPKLALMIFGGLFVLGIVMGLLIDMRGGRYFDKDTAECDCKDGASPEAAQHNTFRHRAMHTLKHGLKIFIWTFCIMSVFTGVQQFFDIETWVKGNVVLMIVLAVALGCIPQSGPHLIFVTLFASGIIPLPVLLASCISQDGHACLPLIAESRRDFVRLKLIKCFLAFAVASASLLVL